MLLKFRSKKNEFPHQTIINMPYCHNKDIPYTFPFNMMLSIAKAHSTTLNHASRANDSLISLPITNFY